MRNRRNGKGQAFVELGIIVAVLITIAIGAIDFGYTFLALHMTTQATAAGARAASVLGPNYRNACGGFVYTTPNRIDAITQLVTSQVGTIATVTNVTVQQCDVNCSPVSGTLPCSVPDMPKVRVTVVGTIPRVVGLFGSSPLAFSRTETFRDESR